jgi:hypothetical protein
LLDAVLQAACRIDFALHAGTVATEVAKLSEQLAQAATAWNKQTSAAFRHRGPVRRILTDSDDKDGAR